MNQKVLLGQVPVLYHRMIKTMMLSGDRKEIVKHLNDMLSLLRKYCGKHILIPDELSVKTDDFIDDSGANEIFQYSEKFPYRT